MAKRSSLSSFGQDLSAFLPIILMLIGILTLILISNVTAIVSNPQNIRITSILATEDPNAMPSPNFANRTKTPSYVDVHRDRLIIYPEESVVAVPDLEQPDNPLERLLRRVQAHKSREYVILLIRPGSAIVVNRLKQIVRDRGIDLGCELYEADRPVEYERAVKMTESVK